MKSIVLMLSLFLTGCMGSSLPVIIPTGNPITDVLVSAAIEEGARCVAARVVPALLDGVPLVGPHRPYRARYPGAMYNPRQGLTFMD